LFSVVAFKTLIFHKVV